MVSDQKVYLNKYKEEFKIQYVILFYLKLMPKIVKNNTNNN